MIGVFDSGIGGLTVIKELLAVLPERDFTYFGDTARTPYGTRGPETIIRYATQDTRFLIDQGAKIIIAACHTASAVAANDLKKQFDLPIFDVVGPAIAKAKQLTKTGRIGIIGTKATINSGIYQSQLVQKPMRVFTQACPLFVPLVEEGWTKQPETKMIAKRYLYQLKLNQIDTLVLACTHYPLIRNIIQQKIGRRVQLVDPAHEVVLKVKQYLADHPRISDSLPSNYKHLLYFSDLTEKTTTIARKWLGRDLPVEMKALE